MGVLLTPAAAVSFVLAAAVNYFLCIALLFRHKARWNSTTEAFLYTLVVATIGLMDLGATKLFIATGQAPWLAKSSSSFLGLFLNFFGRRLVVFPQPTRKRASPLNRIETAPLDEPLD
jgi:dolichol-phosphate mannosyltransferase